jgi:hypothetical protein
MLVEPQLRSVSFLVHAFYQESFSLHLLAFGLIDYLAEM